MLRVVASSVLRMCKRMQQLPTTGNNMQQGVQTGGRNMTVDKGYVHTMPDIFSCRHQRRQPVHTAPKCGIKPIQYVTLHFRDPRGAASLRYRNRAKVTVVMCEQKPYPV